jgi:hypothetical protein
LGNALGSFNSWARLISGALAGLAIAWVVFPSIESYIVGSRSARRESVTTSHSGEPLAKPLPPDIQREF